MSMFQSGAIPGGSPPPFSPPVPSPTVAPAITGQLTLGQTLSLSDGTWSGSPTGFVKRWLRNGAQVGTGNSYTLAPQDVAQEIAGEVVALNGSGPSLPVVVQAGRCRQVPVNAGLPTASALPLVGQVVTVKTGIWIAFPEAAFTYQWRRGAANIVGATAPSYTLTDDDIGQVIACRITATNSAGSSTADTNGIGPVSPALLAPVNTVLPAITGTPTVGQSLSASNGSWTASPPPSFTYQWRRNGSPIPGATAASYTLQVADEAATITIAVTAANSQGNATAISAGVGPVAPEVGGGGVSVASVSADTPVVNVGGPLVLTVALSGPAPVGGAAVQVTASGGMAFTPVLPQTISIPAGQVFGTLTLTGAGTEAVGLLTATGVTGCTGSAQVDMEVASIMVGATINAEGFFAALATTPGATEINKRFQIRRATFDSLGQPATVNEIGWVRVRRRRPRTTGLSGGDYGGTFAGIDFGLQVALSTALYAGDGVPGATNNSTQQKPRLVFRWLNNIGYPMGNSMTLEADCLSANPRDGLSVRAMEFIVRDPVSAIERRAFAALPVKRAHPVTGFVSDVWSATLDLTDIPEGARPTVRAICYGPEGQIYDTDDWTTAVEIQSRMGTYAVLKHNGIATSPPIAFLDDAASSQAVSTDIAAARTTPFARTGAGLQAAMAAARVLNNARSVPVDGCDGLVVYLTTQNPDPESVIVGALSGGTAVPLLASGIRIVSDDVGFPTGFRMNGVVALPVTGSLLSPARYGLTIEGARRIDVPASTNHITLGSGTGLHAMLRGRADGSSIFDATASVSGRHLVGADHALWLQDFDTQNAGGGAATGAFFTGGSAQANRVYHFVGLKRTGAALAEINWQATTIIGCDLQSSRGTPWQADPAGTISVFADSSKIAPALISTGPPIAYTGAPVILRRCITHTIVANGNFNSYPWSADAQITFGVQTCKWVGCTLLAGPGHRANQFYADGPDDPRNLLHAGATASIIMFAQANKTDKWTPSVDTTESASAARQVGGAMFGFQVDCSGNWHGRTWDQRNGTQDKTLDGIGSNTRPADYGTAAAPNWANPGFVDPLATLLGTITPDVGGNPSGNSRLAVGAAARGAVQYEHVRPYRWDIEGTDVLDGTVPGAIRNAA